MYGLADLNRWLTVMKDSLLKVNCTGFGVEHYDGSGILSLRYVSQYGCSFSLRLEVCRIQMSLLHAGGI